MWHILLSAVNLFLAAISLTLGIVKASAARREPGPALTLTASVLMLCALIFILATPAVYRAVGSVLHAPNLPGLLISCATLLCVGHAHLMTQLWQPGRDTPRALRRWSRTWGLLYVAPQIAMVTLYALADLPGRAMPLRFAACYARVPDVLALELIYFTALTTGVLATVVQCRALAIPGRPDLAQALGRCITWFCVALSLDLLNIALTLSAMAGALLGDHRLDFLAEGAWIATIASCLAANWGLGALVLASRRDERRDYEALEELWRIVVRPTPQLVLAPGTLWSGWDTRIALSRRLIEIRDGARHLIPWMSGVPADAVRQLADDARHAPDDGTGQCLIPPLPPQRWQNSGRARRRRPALPASTRAVLRRAAAPKTPPAGPPHLPHTMIDDPADLVAAQAAATILHAAACRNDDAPPLPDDERIPALPGIDVPSEHERAHLVRVAAHLKHPIVQRALTAAAKTD
ncbi:DUF6545 domain-containing protein [Streptomyces sp. NPDC002004]